MWSDGKREIGAKSAGSAILQGDFKKRAGTP